MRRFLVLLAGAALIWLLVSILTGGLHFGARTVNGQSYGFFSAHLGIPGLVLFALLFAIYFFVTRPERRTCARCGHALRRNQARCPACNVVFLSRH
jgi:hypothetical protein